MKPIRIGVIGQSGRIPSEVEKMAEAVGREIGKRGAVLFPEAGTG